MDSKLVFPAALLVLLCLIDTGLSQGEGSVRKTPLKCYQCNSYKDAHCADPFYFEDDLEAKRPKDASLLTNCDPDTDTVKHFCRKIYQNVRGDERVIRSCGTIKDEREGRECYTTVLEEYNTLVCQCDGDGCNSANLYKVSTFAVLSAALLAYLIH